jgi:hypothetical protein
MITGSFNNFSHSFLHFLTIILCNSLSAFYIFAAQIKNIEQWWNIQTLKS